MLSKGVTWKLYQSSGLASFMLDLPVKLVKNLLKLFKHNSVYLSEKYQQGFLTPFATSANEASK